MTTTVANSLFDRLIEAFPPNRPYGRDEVRRDPMPEPVSAYLEQLLETRLRELLESELPDDAWVDVYAPEVKQTRAAYRKTLEKHQAVPARAWADELKSACHDTIRYLVQPTSTLVEAVFTEGSASQRSEDVLRKMAFFSPYPYFRNVVEAYFEQKNAARIERERFEGLLRRTDRQMTSDFSPVQWRRLLDPLLDVLSAAGRRDIPLELLKNLLGEKGAERPLRHMKQRYGLDGFIPFEELEDIFVEEEEVDKKSTAAPTRRTDERDREERPAGRGPSSVPLWKQFESGHHAGGSQDSQRIESENGSSEPLWKQFRRTTEPPSKEGGTSLPDVERSVLGERGAKNRDLFIKHLFSGKRDDYESTLRRLAHAGSWSQASQIIAQEVFLKHEVNIYSDPAVAFTDAAEAQYRT